MRCIAFFPDGYPCRATASESSRWCELHESQQAKTLKAYKRYTGALGAFDDQQLCESRSHVEGCDSLQQLINWQSAAREKWALADRVIHARSLHHSRFCQGGDKGHQVFIDTLEEMKRKLEAQMAMLDERAYRIALRKQEAQWLLDEGEETREPCCEEGANETVLGSPVGSESGEVKSRSGSMSTQSSLSSASSANSTSTAPTDEMPESDGHDTRPEPSVHALLVARLAGHFGKDEERPDHFAVVENLFRFVIARSPALFVKAEACAEDCRPAEFVSRVDLTVADLKVLEKGLRFGPGGLLSPYILRNAITSVHRQPSDQAEDRVTILGGSWWRKPLKRSMTLREWQLLHDFVHCNGCALKVTRNFDEWILWRSEARRGGLLPHFANQSAPSCDAQLNKVGAAFVRYSDDAKRSIERIQPKSKKMKIVYVEHDARCWVCLRISLSCQRSGEALDAIRRDARYELLLADDTDSRPWTTRLRSGLSPSARRAAQWTEDRHFVAPHAFEAMTASPFARETVDAVVLSAKAPDGEKIADFADSLAHVVEQALRA